MKLNLLFNEAYGGGWDEGYPKTLRDLLTQDNVVVRAAQQPVSIPPEAEPFLDSRLYHHKYNKLWWNGESDDNCLQFDDWSCNEGKQSPGRVPVLSLTIGVRNKPLMYVDGEWEERDFNKQY
jgi:hypothetical protein